MSDSLESIKDTIRDHPTETVAVVSAVSIIGVVFYYRNKEKKTAIATAAPCKCKPDQIGWFSRYLEYRHARVQLKLAAA